MKKVGTVNTKLSFHLFMIAVFINFYICIPLIYIEK